MSICDAMDVEPSVGIGISVTEVVEVVEVLPVLVEVPPEGDTVLLVDAEAVKLPVDGAEDPDPALEALEALELAVSSLPKFLPDLETLSVSLLLKVRISYSSWSLGSSNLKTRMNLTP